MHKFFFKVHFQTKKKKEQERKERGRDGKHRIPATRDLQ
jgi:hypothetical protein